MNTLAERLRLAMESATPKKIKGVALAKAVGVTPTSVSDWLTSKSKTMEGENLLKAAKFLDVNPMWLANGTGDMRSQKTNEQTQPDHLLALIQQLETLSQSGKLTDDLVRVLQNTVDLVTKSQENKNDVANGIAPDSKAG